MLGEELAALGPLDDAVVVGARSAPTTLPTPSSASVSRVGALVLGRVVDRADADDRPWPGISRGTESCGPDRAGLVRVTVVPAKSSGVSLFARTLRMTSSYAAQNPAKSSVVGALDVRHQQGPRPVGPAATSTARPRLTWSWRTTSGLPSTSAKSCVIAGTASRACTIGPPDQVGEADLAAPAPAQVAG